MQASKKLVIFLSAKRERHTHTHGEAQGREGGSVREKENNRERG